MTTRQDRHFTQSFRATLYWVMVCATVTGGWVFGLQSPARAFEPIVGQVAVFAFKFCPRGWTKADGKLLPISSNDALFSLYGTSYGGDGKSTFALPKLNTGFTTNTDAPTVCVALVGRYPSRN